MAALVSVIALCYDHAPFVEESLASVIAQTYRPIELLIVDDASTDGSQARIRSFVSRCPIPVQFFALPKNGGNCRAFNYAFAQSRGDFILDLATDDLLYPHRIAEQVATFQKLDKTYGVVFSDVDLIAADGQSLGTYYDRRPKPPSGDLYAALLKGGGLISAASMLIRREVLERLGGYDETLAYEDYDFWVRSARHYQYFFLDHVLTQRRILPHSLTHQFYRLRQPKMLASTYRVCQKAFSLNQHPKEDQALIQSLRYHLRQSVLTENFQIAKDFIQLLRLVRQRNGQKPSLHDIFWHFLTQTHLPLGWLYLNYQRWYLQIK